MIFIEIHLTNNNYNTDITAADIHSLDFAHAWKFLSAPGLQTNCTRLI